MKHQKSIFIIVAISIAVGLLHFIIGPNYGGFAKNFVNGYLMDVLLPMNLYLLTQVSFRKQRSKRSSRIFGASLSFFFGLGVELLQGNGIAFLGSTYDVWDIVMYGIGIILGLCIDLLIIDRWEQAFLKKL